MTGQRAASASTVALLVASLLAIAPAQAAPGDLDPTFSGEGKQITDFGGDEHAADVAVGADGKIVVVGAAAGDFALARYTPDGSLDPTFSGDGKQTTDFGGAGDAATGVAVQADGKIVAVGTGAAAFALARYNPDGSLDPTFSGDGKETTDFGGGGGGAQSVALQADGRIVAAGGGGGGLALARYTADGSLDTTFSSDGRQTAADLASAFDVAVGSDGKIVVLGGASVVMRFDPDGTPDATFSGDGRQTTDFVANAVAVQPDGKVVAAGNSEIYFAVARYSADGSLDPTFSGDGRQTPIFGGGLWGEYATTVTVQPNGKIVVAGHCCDSDLGGDFAVARLNGDGSLDASFSGDGTQTTDFDTGNDTPYAVAFQADGKLVAAGVSVPGDGAGGDFALARYQGGGDEPATAPANLTAPTISGAATEGQTLTVTPAAWSGTTPITVTDHWKRCDATGAILSCQFIGGAVGTTYTIDASDVGHTIRVYEEASNQWGLAAVESAPTAVVTAKPTPGTITGTVRNAKTGAGIANASVSCGSGYSAKTATGGRYSISNVPPSDYHCTATASGYRSSTQTVTVAAGQTATTANFSLVRS